MSYRLETYFSFSCSSNSIHIKSIRSNSHFWIY
nr:MAG TPA: hypothetical protein [Bacteriophage sp.]